MLDEAEKWFKLAASKNLSQAYIKLDGLPPTPRTHSLSTF